MNEEEKYQKELELYQKACLRAQEYGKSNPRTGMESMFTSSKAYCCLEKLFAADAKAGFKGIYCGPQCTGDGYIKEPFMKKNTRETIRGCIWPAEEKEEDTNPYFDHGNRYESYATMLFTKLSKSKPENFTVTGRINCEDPAFDWMAATPDGLFFSEKKGLAYIVEVKCPVSRKIETTQDPVHISLDMPFKQPVYASFDVEGNEENEEKYECRDMDFDEIAFYRESKIPPHYVLQMLLECKSSGIPRAAFVQFQPGGMYRMPELHLTMWEFDERLWLKMSEYWSRCWGYVLEGRRLAKQLEAWRAYPPEQITPEHRTAVESLATRMENTFPWPLKKGRGEHHIPFVFDK